MPAPLPTKRCSKCTEVKKLSEFYKSARASGDGHDGLCKGCRSNYSRNWRKENVHINYDLTQEQHEQMLETRGSRCPICGEIDESPYIDHCHKTGKVRGLLCQRCNTALGFLRDNPRACLRAAIYLQSAADPGFPCNLSTLNSLVDEAFAGLKPRRRSAVRFRFAGH